MLFSVIPLLSSQLLLLRTHNPPALPSITPGHEVSTTIVRPRPRLKIFHPPSNSCIFRLRYENPLNLAPCEQTDSWKYTPQKFLKITGTYFCLKAVGPNLPAKLSISCDESDSQWIPMSGPQTTHLSTRMKDGSVLCLDVDEGGTIVTNPCRGFSGDAEAASGDSQWFQIRSFS